jgi:alpha-galactosidase
MIDRGVGIESYSHPGGFNDYDMLIVGLKGQSQQLVGAGCTDVEYRTHFSMWSILGSPLIACNDLRTMDAATKTILTNTEVIALNQDPLGKAATKKRTSGSTQVFAKPLADGSWGVALLNRGTATASMTLSFQSDLGVTWTSASVRDLWAHQDKGIFSDSYTASVQGHEAVTLRLFPK